MSLHAGVAGNRYQKVNEPLDKYEQAVLTALSHAAASGGMCPCNATLAVIMDCESIGTPPNVMKRLQAKGLIAVERYQTARVVTICATGDRTKEPRDKVPHWRDRGAKARTLDRFADLLSEGKTVQEAAAALEVTTSYCRSLLHRIRHQLGWQAV